MIKNNLILLLSLLVIVTGCRKDIDGLGDTTEVMNPVDVTNLRVANLNGLITDLAGAPIANANVELNGEVITTDQYGYFRFTEKAIDREGSMVKFSKTGYFDSYKFVYPTSAGDYSHIKVSLPGKDLSGTFNANNGGAVETPGGAKVTFGTNAIMDADGNAYTGSVNVYTHWYNPTSDNISMSMPGDLRAVDALGAEVQLATFGMLAVELETPDGQPLNISEGNTAELTFPLGDLTTGAPEEIPLWYLDEESGIWKEEGQATKVGNTYVGTVSHFSFWNCDAPFPLVNINGIIKDANDNLLKNAWLCMEVVGEGQSWWTTSYGWTDQNGEYFGKIPKNKIIRFSVKDNCGNVIHEEEIGPFDSDITMDPIIVDYQGLVSVFGMVTDCDGNLVTDGYVVFSVDNPNFPEYPTNVVVAVDEEGNFSYAGDLCQSLSGTLQAFDYASATYSDEIEFEATAGESIDLGVISLCEQLDEYFIFNLDGTSGLYDFMEVCILDGNAVISSLSPNGWPTEIVKINGIALGDNIAESYQMSTSNTFVFCNEDCDGITWDITDLGNSTGDYVEGTFEGEAEQDSLNGTTISVSGSFRAQIDFIGAGASISGMAWEDTNGNGIRETGEPPLANVYLGIETQSTQTDANGQYILSGIKPGTYTVWMESNYPGGPVDQGGDDTIDNDFDGWNGVTVTLAEGENLENLDAGLITSQPLECYISYSEFCEITGDGLVIVEVIGGSGGGYAFTIYDSFGNPFDSNGFGTFEIFGFVAGTITVDVVSPDGETCTSSIDLVGFQDTEVIASAWLDNNGDGTYDELDDLIPGVLFEFFDNGNLVYSQELNENSNSVFFAPWYAGTFDLQVTAPDGYQIGALPISMPPDLLNANIGPDPVDPTIGVSTFTVTGCDEVFQFAAAIVPE